jgi:transposase
MLMALERLQDPCSKRSNYIHQSDYIDMEPVYLQHLYRALDKLADNNELIQKQIFQTGRDLFNQTLDVVFYDVTTLYFESADEFETGNRQLRKKGFSKDGKVGDTQVLFSMMIDKDKNPICYQVFKGNTYEGHTLSNAIETLKKRYTIDKIIIVADRGMIGKKNIEVINESGFEFIIGDRIKNMSPELQKPLLDLSGYQQQWIYTDKDDEQIVIRYTTLQHEGKTFIATYSDKRAGKDKAEREQLLQKAQKLLEKPEQLKKKASRHFLKQTKKTNYIIDTEKIKHQEQFDGILVIATNNKTLTATDVLSQYKQLFKIEQTFRTFKSHLETRPVFHWTDKRIEGHICLCYIAFTLQHWVLHKLKDFPISMTEEILRDMLDRMQLSRMQHNGQKVYLRSSPQPHELKMQQLLGLKQLPPILPQRQLASYI